MSDEIRTLTREETILRLDDFLALDANTDGEHWGPEHFLLDLPGKWACSQWAVSDRQHASGFAVASIKEDAVHIHRLVVDALHRRRGLGGALLRAVGEAGERLQCHRMTLKVSGTNKRAIAFYGRLGFEDENLERGASTLKLGLSLESLLQPPPSSNAEVVGPD